MPYPAWSPDRADLLTEMWNADARTVDIAAALKVTRNAVLGKVHRLGLKERDLKQFVVRGEAHPGFRSGKFAGQPTRPPGRGIGSYQRRKQRMLAFGRISAPVPKISADRQRKAERRQAMLDLKDYPNAVHILERDYYQCPWPLWDDSTPFSEKMFCGSAVEQGGHYCAAHMCMAYDVRLPGQFRSMHKPNWLTIRTGMGQGRAA